MKILVFTNTFPPHVGGVARSVHRFVDALKARGHSVLVVAPLFEGAPAHEPGVLRVPSLLNFNGSGFSVPLPAPVLLARAVRGFAPDIVHSHHPYLLGNSALRYAACFGVPLVFTHHTLYELYTHYVPGDSVLLKRFVVSLAVSYCNVSDHVIAPSDSVVSLLRYRGVRSPVSVIPTGIDRGRFSGGNGKDFRKRFSIPEDAFVVGHVGRLAREKNLEFLTLALSHYLQANPRDHALIAGVGPMEGYMRKVLGRHGLDARVHMTGILGEDELPHAYGAMDVFAFASRSETQGLVLMEAFASGLPVVALNGPGVKDVVTDFVTGRLIAGTDVFQFVRALLWVRSLDPGGRRQMEDELRRTVARFDMERCVDEVTSLYQSLCSGHRVPSSSVPRPARVIDANVLIAKNAALALGQAAAPASRELYACRVDLPQDADLQSLLARHSGVRARFLGWLVSLAIRLLKTSWRTQAFGIETLRERLAGPEPVLVSFWHGKYLALFALLEGLHGCIFASCSFRGEVIAEICRRFGYECILIPEHARKRAVSIMAKAIRHYGAGAVAADGPQGPGRVFKAGSVQLSSDLGMAVVPASVASRPRFVAKGRWDRFETPFPFSRVCLVVGKGIEVPVGLQGQELEGWAIRLKEELDSIDAQAEEKVERPVRGRRTRVTGRRGSGGEPWQEISTRSWE
ncbi:MAG TPA: glycosyltransferase [Deltaproteobacteria bacterium]|jgi:glycosyltransferase involved in cell wall biosynthesis/lysophospholipid acyltransferase (LPLAT)-like uncharacterized protein|nr:glycosyltransferase [Deltaproteobacteria bacterium]HOI06134.1 glycosyltransferase [Deltaproteobacteria bacterium]